VAGVPGRNVVVMQCIACIEWLKAHLAAAGRDLTSVTHLSVYMKDIESFRLIERLLMKAFGKSRPAMIALEVPMPSPVAGVQVSITAIAWFGEGKPNAIGN